MEEEQQEAIFWGCCVGTQASVYSDELTDDNLNFVLRLGNAWSRILKRVVKKTFTFNLKE